MRPHLRTHPPVGPVGSSPPRDEGAATAGYASAATDDAVQANVVAISYQLGAPSAVEDVARL